MSQRHRERQHLKTMSAQLCCEDSSESWTWDSQPETEMNFTNWHPLNTHNNRTENCLVLMDSRTLTWLTLPCSGREDGSLVLQPFCEKTLESSGAESLA